jgi:DNA polymerase-3 subunit gamma/tau
MFENILGQPVIEQLKADIAGETLPASILFAGPPNAGKGTAALELARVFSCENATGSAPWNCACPACGLHRNLAHPDLLVAGPRPFNAEISASAAAFLRDHDSQAARMLFLRAVAKLLLRFSPVLCEDDPKAHKLNSQIEAVNDDMAEIAASAIKPEKFEKTLEAIVKNTAKLQADGVSDQIPVSQIRSAAYWLHLAPRSGRKLLVIENADKMNDSARNSLLKTLEEPPATGAIVLTSARPKALLATILSRVRPYAFSRRDEAGETEVIRRVFRGESSRAETREHGGSLLGAYLDSFQPVSDETLAALAAQFTAALQRPLQEGAAALAAILAGAGNFESRVLFTKFLGLLLDNFLRDSRERGGGWIYACDLWRRLTREAQTACEIYKQSPAAALQRLFTELKRQ